MKRLWRSRKALSPVVAAIILIAVTVAVSIAVAAWMGALTFTWMGYEELEITSVTWTPNTAFTITVGNTGTKDVTINSVKVNHLAATVSSPSLPTVFKTTDSEMTITVTYGYTNGSGYDVAVVTSSGHEFTDHFTGGQDES
jgi:flagellin-like protein